MKTTLTLEQLSASLGGAEGESLLPIGALRTWAHPRLRLAVERHDFRGRDLARGAVSDEGVLLIGFRDDLVDCWTHRSAMATGRMVAALIDLGSDGVRPVPLPREGAADTWPPPGEVLELTDLLARCRAAPSRSAYLIHTWCDGAWRPLVCLERAEVLREGEGWYVVSPAVADWGQVTVSSAGPGGAWLQLCCLSELAAAADPSVRP